MLAALFFAVAEANFMFLQEYGKLKVCSAAPLRWTGFLFPLFMPFPTTAQLKPQTNAFPSFSRLPNAFRHLRAFPSFGPLPRSVCLRFQCLVLVGFAVSCRSHIPLLSAKKRPLVVFLFRPLFPFVTCALCFLPSERPC